MSAFRSILSGSFSKVEVWGTVLFITLALIWGTGFLKSEYQWSKNAVIAPPVDFGVYYTAGKVVRLDDEKRIYSYSVRHDPASGRTIVLNPQMRPPRPDSLFAAYDEEAKSNSQYLYPPFWAGVVAPFTTLEYKASSAVWHGLCFLFGVAAILCVVLCCTSEPYEIAILTVLGAVGLHSSLPMSDLLLVGNIGSLVAFLFALGVLCHERLPKLSSLAIAIAVFIKLTPIAIIPVFILRKRVSWIASFIVWSAILLFTSIIYLGAENHVEFLTKVLPSMSDGVPSINNKSLLTIIGALFEGQFFSESEIAGGSYVSSSALPGSIFKVMAAVSYIVLLWFLGARKKGESDLGIELYLVAIWSLLFSPVVWRHGYILGFAAALFAWLHPSTKEVSKGWLLLLALGAFLAFSPISALVSTLSPSFGLQIVSFVLMPIGLVIYALFYIFWLLGTRSTSS